MVGMDRLAILVAAALMLAGCGTADPQLDAARRYIGGNVEVISWQRSDAAAEVKRLAIEGHEQKAAKIRAELDAIEPTEENRTLIDIKGDLLRIAERDIAEAEAAPVATVGRLRYRAGGKTGDDLFLFDATGKVIGGVESADDPVWGPAWERRSQLFPAQ